MASLSIPIQDGEDDAGHFPGFWSWTATQLEMGWDPVNWGAEFHGFIRWPVTFSIPKPLVITAAQIEFWAFEDPGPGTPPFDPGEMYVRFFNEDANPSARDFTTDLYASWLPTGARIPWSPGGTYSAPLWLITSDISLYVQAWVNRVDFANGQYFAVRMDPPDTPGNGIVQVDTYEQFAAKPAVLKIWYAADVPPVITPGQPAASVRVPKYPAEIIPPTETVEEFAEISDRFIAGLP